MTIMNDLIFVADLFIQSYCIIILSLFLKSQANIKFILVYLPILVLKLSKTQDLKFHDTESRN